MTPRWPPNKAFTEVAGELTSLGKLDATRSMEDDPDLLTAG